MKNTVILRNVMFPVWLLFLFPITWPIILAGNFAVDSLVLYIGMRRLAIEDKKAFYKQHILKIWGCGFLGDIPGFLLMLFLSFVDGYFYNEALPRDGQSPGYDFFHAIAQALPMNPFENIWAVLCATVAVALSALCIYWLNYKLVYRKTGLEDGPRKRLSLLMAIATAPWLFYLPTRWFY